PLESDPVISPSFPDLTDSPLESDPVISPSFPDLTDSPLESDPVISPSLPDPIDSLPVSDPVVSPSLPDPVDSLPVSDPVFSPSLPDSTVSKGHERKLPYETLSFPELKIPAELLPDEDDLSLKERAAAQDISFDTFLNKSASSASPEPTPFETLVSLRQDVVKNDMREMDSSANDLESPLENLLEKSRPSMDTFTPVPNGTVPRIDKLECSILAYLPFGYEVKKDVIKNLLPNTYVDDDFETTINQLLASGEVSSIVKDGIVYLTKTSEKETK
ncbi:hypothetical protein HNV12_28310, partial [Methanococcoides sp. SA1]|nr:hypothetical protein [Methanococcoides sp. SA1]